MGVGGRAAGGARARGGARTGGATRARGDLASSAIKKPALLEEGETAPGVAATTCIRKHALGRTRTRRAQAIRAHSRATKVSIKVCNPSTSIPSLHQSLRGERIWTPGARGEERLWDAAYERTRTWTGCWARSIAASAVRRPAKDNAGGGKRGRDERGEGRNATWRSPAW